MSIGSKVLCLLRGCLCQAAWSTSWAPRPLGSYITAYIAVLHARRTTHTPVVSACVNFKIHHLHSLQGILSFFIWIRTSCHCFRLANKIGHFARLQQDSCRGVMFHDNLGVVLCSNSSQIAASAFGLCSTSSAPHDGVILPIKGLWGGGSGRALTPC